MKIKLPLLKFIPISCLVLAASGINAQISFTNSNNLLHSNTGVLGSNANARSGNALTVTDMNFDGLDDVCKLIDNGEVRIEYQQAGGTFTYQYIGTMGTSAAWSMCVGDVDKNGYKDVLVGYNGSLKLMKINASGSMGVTTLPNSSFFLQNINFMDVNNDSWLDIFACDDNSYAKLYLNNGSGSFPSEAGNSVINFDVTPGQSTGTSNDDSGNYGSVWTDFDNDGDVDLYVAHCRQSVSSSTDPRRIDKVYVNNGSGVFTVGATSLGLSSGDQDWTASFGDINNDGDFDLFLTKHDVTSKLYTNNGSGTFTAGNTITFGSMPMQSQFEDLDNDGFVDIIITGDNDHRIYRNNSGNGTFTDVTPSNLTVGSNLLSFATGDLNHDGKIDIYGSYGTTYNNPGSQDDRYWKNSTSNSNHFLSLIMLPSISNKDGLGARAYIYGAWGVQTREVRGGESYGTVNSGHLHFGLGAATAVDSVIVKWPSGVRTKIANPTIDQFLNVSEQNPCTLSGASITPSGPTNLCTGGSVTLAAPTGNYTYLWSNNATTQSISVNAAGSYAVTVTETAAPICHTTSPSVTITVNADETPTITPSAATTFCENDPVTLTSTTAAAYTWSNGSTTQSIQPTQTGTYSVTIQGACQNWTSNSISITVLASPAPTSSDVYISSPSSVTLNATGNNLNWYSSSTGGTSLGTGNAYTTPVNNNTTTYYVDATSSYGGSVNHVGQKYHYGTTYSSSSINPYMLFDVTQACKLKKVKVYTDTPGKRLIELRSATGTVLQTYLANIPVDSSFVTLNFSLAAGQSYQLGTNDNQNDTLLGYVSPRLQRSNSNVSYPYTVNNLISITGSSQATTAFYYFYDWEVDIDPTICVSDRTPVTVYLSPTGISSVNDPQAISVSPNPTNELLNISLGNAASIINTVELKDITGRLVYSSVIEKGNTLHSLNVANFATGPYILSVKNKEGMFVQKVMFIN